MQAVIDEVLTVKEGAHFNYKLGDEYRSASYHETDPGKRGDGVVIFFLDSPTAVRRVSMAYANDKILALDDLRLHVLKEKCKSGA